MYNYNSHLFDEMALPVIPTADMLGLPDDMIIPEAYRQYMAINLADLIGKICLDSAGFSTLYMDADLMQILIGVWSRSRIQTWQRLYNTYFLRYNPLWNKDGHIDRTTAGSGTKDNQASATSNSRVTSSQYQKNRGFSAEKGFDAGSTTYNVDISAPEPLQVPLVTGQAVTATNTNTDEEQVVNMALNIHDLPPINPKPGNTPTPAQAMLNITDGVQSESTVGDLSHRAANASDVNKETTTRNDTETVHEYGNIGVTTSQQMLEAERALAMNNLYETISREFVKKFCILVY